jgi:hypothetical protein
MPYLVPAVVVLALLAVIQLLFTLAILRRLRNHGERLARFEVLDAGPEPAAPGETIGAFTTPALTGAMISDTDLRDSATTVGFFSPSCGPCTEQLPSFEERARRHRSLAFVIDEGEPSRHLAERLAEVATVALVSADSPVTQAFSVYGYPVIFEIDAEARVIASAHDVGSMPQLAPTL